MSPTQALSCWQRSFAVIWTSLRLKTRPQPPDRSKLKYGLSFTTVAESSSYGHAYIDVFFSIPPWPKAGFSVGQMARGLWSGAISFGLIHIPVEVMSAKDQKRISFRLLDKTDFSPVGYKQVNKSTGREVQRKNIVKGYEYSPSQFVVVTEMDFSKVNPEATQTLEHAKKAAITQFVMYKKEHLGILLGRGLESRKSSKSRSIEPVSSQSPAVP